MTTTGHLDDAALIAHLDGGDAEVGQTEEHLRECPACADRLRVIRQRSESLAGWFTHDEPFPVSASVYREGRRSSAESLPGRLKRRRGMLVAAGIALVIAGFGLTPLGALTVGWMGERLGLNRDPVVEGSAEVHRFEFDVTGPTLLIRISGDDPEGTIEIHVEDANRGSVAVQEGDGSEVVGVKRGGLDLRLGAGASRVVRLRLPGSVTQVDLEISGTRVRPSWDPSEETVPRSWTFRLPG